LPLASAAARISRAAAKHPATTPPQESMSRTMVVASLAQAAANVAAMAS
jgi:hypothetical protein